MLKRFSKPSKTFELYCYLWIAAKYDKPNRILSIVQSRKSLWEQEPFLTRQVIAILPRVRTFKPEVVETILQEQISIGPEDAASVAHNILKLESIERLDKKLTPYLFPTIKHNTYPIAKFLILQSILRSKNIKSDINIKTKIYDHITDPWMKRWIRRIYK